MGNFFSPKKLCKKYERGGIVGKRVIMAKAITQKTSLKI